MRTHSLPDHPVDRRLAQNRNIAGWTAISLASLSIFWATANSAQTEGVRIAAAIVGPLTALVFASLNLATHWPLMCEQRPTLIGAILVANVIPALFWAITFFATREWRFAQNKQ